MTMQRNILFIAFILVSFLLWQAWQTDHAPRPAVPAQTVGQVMQDDRANSSRLGQLITIKSDVLSLTVNTYGGDIQGAELRQYSDKLNVIVPHKLLMNRPDFVYIAESGLIGRDGPDNAATGTHRPVYHVTKTKYVLPKGANEIRVPLTYSEGGKIFTKEFVLYRGKYAIDVDYRIQNHTSQPLEVAMYGQLKQSINLPKDILTGGGGGLGLNAFRGAAYSTDSNNYKKYKFDEITKQNLNETTHTGWVAMLQHYFASAWIPEQAQDTMLYTRATNNDSMAAIGFKSAITKVAPDTEKVIGAKLWLGPEIQKQLAATAKHLDLVVDYGWLWFLSQPLFHLLKFIQSFVSNWGLAIIVITFIVRGIMFPLTRAQYRSMAMMKLLQPRLQALKERYGDDRQKLSQETMALYKNEKVNPLGGCLPLVIQMPIFLALFYMLGNSVELRHAPFMLWIQDLSAADPYYILPILMGTTMFLIQKMSPTPVVDPLQQKLMTFMPIIFTAFFLWFPAGLVLYYIVSNLFTIVQQRVIYWELEKKGLHTRK